MRETEPDDNSGDDELDEGSQQVLRLWKVKDKIAGLPDNTKRYREIIKESARKHRIPDSDNDAGSPTEK